MTLDFSFSGPVIEWRGPAPYYFLEVPVDVSDDIKEAARGLEYWGQVAVDVVADGHRFTTALFPKDGRYLVPLKVAVRRGAGFELGQVLDARLGLTGRDAP